MEYPYPPPPQPTPEESLKVARWNAYKGNKTRWERRKKLKEWENLDTDTRSE